MSIKVLSRNLQYRPVVQLSLFKTQVQLINNIVLVSGVQHSDSINRYKLLSIGQMCNKDLLDQFFFEQTVSRQTCLVSTKQVSQITILLMLNHSSEQSYIALTVYYYYYYYYNFSTTSQQVKLIYESTCNSIRV